jgi:hypothetical protein
VHLTVRPTDSFDDVLSIEVRAISGQKPELQIVWGADCTHLDYPQSRSRVCLPYDGMDVRHTLCGRSGLCHLQLPHRLRVSILCILHGDAVRVAVSGDSYHNHCGDERHHYGCKNDPRVHLVTPSRLPGIMVIGDGEVPEPQRRLPTEQ